MTSHSVSCTDSLPSCNTGGEWLLFRKKGLIQSWRQQNCRQWLGREPPWKAERLHIRDLLVTFPLWTNVSRALTLRFIWCVGSSGMIPRCQFQQHHSQMIQPSSSPHPQPPAGRSLGGCLNHLVTEWVSHTWLSLTLIVAKTQLHPYCFPLAASWWQKPSEKLCWGASRRSQVITEALRASSNCITSFMYAIPPSINEFIHSCFGLSLNAALVLVNSQPDF